MRVYVETNFLLEIAYRQEEHVACESLLAAAEEGRLELRVPAVCLTEASASVARRFELRSRALNAVRQEEAQLARGDGVDLDQFRADLAKLDDRLNQFVNRDEDRLPECRSRLMTARCVLPVTTAAADRQKPDGEAAKSAVQIAENLLLPIGEAGYGSMDALIGGCILADLAERPTTGAVFVTTDGPFRTHAGFAGEAARTGLGLRARFGSAARQALGTPAPHTS